MLLSKFIGIFIILSVPLCYADSKESSAFYDQIGQLELEKRVLEKRLEIKKIKEQLSIVDGRAKDRAEDDRLIVPRNDSSSIVEAVVGGLSPVLGSSVMDSSSDIYLMGIYSSDGKYVADLMVGDMSISVKEYDVLSDGSIISRIKYDSITVIKDGKSSVYGFKR